MSNRPGRLSRAQRLDIAAGVLAMREDGKLWKIIEHRFGLSAAQLRRYVDETGSGTERSAYPSAALDEEQDGLSQGELLMALTNKGPVCVVCGEPANTVRSGRDFCGRHSAEGHTGQACGVCGEPATTVRDGQHYCDWHHQGHHTPATPIVACAMDGCGSPAAANVAGRDLCRHHTLWAERGTAA
jgi:hypothetical protein